MSNFPEPTDHQIALLGTFATGIVTGQWGWTIIAFTIGTVIGVTGNQIYRNKNENKKRPRR